MQAQLSQIMIFGKTFSKSKLLVQILPLNRKLLQGNSFRRTHHATLRTCKTRLMIHSIRLTTLSTVSIRFFHSQYSFFHSQYSSVHSQYSSVHLQYLFSTRSICLSTRSICLSTRSICLSSRSTRSTICRSFYHWKEINQSHFKFCNAELLEISVIIIAAAACF